MNTVVTCNRRSQILDVGLPTSLPICIYFTEAAMYRLALDIYLFPHSFFVKTEHLINDISRDVRKRTFGYVRPAKIRISLRIRAV